MYAFPPSLRLVFAALAGSLLLTACAATPPAAAPPAQIEDNARGSGKEKATEAPRVFRNDQDAVGVVLDGNAIDLLVWNVHKGGNGDWLGDFHSLAAGSELVLLQEARLDEDFARGLTVLPRWDMVEAWQSRRAPTGVLTASSAEPLRVQALEHREPWLRTDKSALVTEYRIAGSAQTLLVANIHAINFTADTAAFRRQLLAIADALDEHEGPVILSGDFNTWRGERRAIVDGITSELGLAEVPFDGPRREFLNQPLDHVFYRDLELVSHRVAAVESSDHNPLIVRFRQPPAQPADTAWIDTLLSGDGS